MDSDKKREQITAKILSIVSMILGILSSLRAKPIKNRTNCSKNSGIKNITKAIVTDSAANFRNNMQLIIFSIRHIRYIHLVLSSIFSNIVNDA